jgi:small subunit ribosomal protein S1
MGEMSDSGFEKSFAEMFDEGFAVPASFEPGQPVAAKVIRIGESSVFIDVGGKSEGYVVLHEFVDKDGEINVKVGDTVKAYFLSAAHSEMLFTTNLGAGSGGQGHLEEACASGIPVEGVVEQEIKGGFEVKLAGSVRAFCPFSQLDLRRIADPEEWLGRSLSFVITQYEENGRNIIVSRRRLLEADQQEKRARLRQTLEVGAVVSGTVTSLRDFGAFVDIDGIEGLLPVSEIGWGRVEDINSHLAVGQQVEVVILKLDWENNRFSFSLKQTRPDPWGAAVSKFPVGSFHTGKVARLTNFGAFVTLAEGVDGLIHISALAGGRRINHPREVIGEGEVVEVRVEAVDPEQKRISLALASALKEAEADAGEDEKVRDYISRTEQKSAGSMGTLGDLLKKKLSD